DWSGRVQTETHPITVTVSTAAPTIAINPTVLTSTHQLAPLSLGLGGAATAGTAALVSVEIDGQLPQPATWEPGENSWLYPWSVAADGERFDVVAQMVDGAGRTAQASAEVLVDVVPPTLVTLDLGYLDGAA